MKAILIVLVIAVAGFLGYSLVAPNPKGGGRTQSHPPSAEPAPSIAPPPTSIQTDQLAVFHSAFWRSPVAGDEILEAQRREWSDAEGLNRWQWFIKLRPSPELLDYVRRQNAFGLARIEAPTPIGAAPSWFAFDPAAVEMLGSSRSNLRFIFSPSDNLLLATNAGSGFTRAAPPPGPAAPRKSPPTPGRLPSAPPPSPADAADAAKLISGNAPPPPPRSAR